MKKKWSDIIGQEIQTAYNKGMTYEWLSENSQGFGFDFRGRVDSIILGGGGPTIYIDLFSKPGCIIIESTGEEKETFKLADYILDEIIDFVEEYENAK